MSQALKPLLPHIAAHLLVLHAGEWSQRSRAIASYVVRRGRGATVILRSPKFDSERLVSARVVVKAPTGDTGWRELRSDLLKSDPLAAAAHRYLFVPERSLADATTAMKRSPVKVRSNQSFKPTPSARLNSRC